MQVHPFGELAFGKLGFANLHWSKDHSGNKPYPNSVGQSLNLTTQDQSQINRQ